jgi:hypothetical protein
MTDWASTRNSLMTTSALGTTAYVACANAPSLLGESSLCGVSPILARKLI